MVKGPVRQRRRWDRKFDWLEARARHKAGETIASIARALGVDRRGVARVLKLPEAYVQLPDELVLGRTDYVECPRCFGPMTIKAELCRNCRNELRLEDTMTVRTIPGTPRGSTVELRDVQLHRSVQVGVEWGVLVPWGPHRPGYRIVDFWWGGPEYVNERTRVRVAPASLVVVNGEDQEAEEI